MWFCGYCCFVVLPQKSVPRLTQVLGPVLLNTPDSDMEEQREGPVVKFLDNKLAQSNRPAVQRGLLKPGKWLTEGS